jgi:hypothetical protein
MDQNKELREELTHAKKDGHFIFVPSTPLPQINGIFVPVLNKIKLRPDDFYTISGKFGLHHHAAMKLADGAGIEWVSEIGRVGRWDDGRNPNRCTFRVVARYRAHTGLFIELPASKHIDLDAKKIALDAKYAEDWEYKNKFGGGKGPNGYDVKKPWPQDKQDFIRYFTNRDINQIKDVIDERCESGAQVRAVRNILHLPAAFSPYKKNGDEHDGVSKYFYIVKYVLDPTNVEVQRVQIAGLYQANLNIYGAAPPVLPPPRIKELPEETQEEDIEPDVPGTKSEDGQTVDFENQSPEDQEKTILALIKNIGYKFYDQDMKDNPPLHMWNQDGRTDYFKHILNSKKGAA